jgi:hypothetical protein
LRRSRGQGCVKSRKGEWYAADEIDELSKEQAEVIAARVVRRLGERTTLPPELASRLTSRMLKKVC